MASAPSRNTPLTESYAGSMGETIWAAPIFSQFQSAGIQNSIGRCVGQNTIVPGALTRLSVDLPTDVEPLTSA